MGLHGRGDVGVTRSGKLILKPEFGFEIIVFETEHQSLEAKKMLCEKLSKMAQKEPAIQKCCDNFYRF